MSIWCSWRTIGTDVRTRLVKRVDGSPALRRYGRQPSPEHGEVRSYAEGFSNHYPTTAGDYEQPANVDTASIPVWCVPGRREEYDDRCGPWLRLSVQTAEHDFYKGGKPTGNYDSASVVMDEEAVRSLLADLTEWLARPKAYPTDERAVSSVVSTEEQP